MWARGRTSWSSRLWTSTTSAQAQHHLSNSHPRMLPAPVVVLEVQRAVDGVDGRVPLSRAAGSPRNDALGVWVWTKSNRLRRKHRHSPTKAATSEKANSRRMGTTCTATSSGGSGEGVTADHAPRHLVDGPQLMVQQQPGRHRRGHHPASPGGHRDLGALLHPSPQLPSRWHTGPVPACSSRICSSLAPLSYKP